MTTETYSPGLEGVVAGETAISTVETGLTYRGYTIEDLAANSTYEEVAYLILHGELPTAAQAAAFRQRLGAASNVPSELIETLRHIPHDAPAMDVLRSAVSLLAHWDPDRSPAKRVRAQGFYARGRFFTPKQIDHIVGIVDHHSREGRTRLSERICRALRWRQPNGSLKDMACREVMRKLDDLGVISLPKPKWGGAKWSSPETFQPPKSEVTALTSIAFGEIQLVRINSKHHQYASLWNTLVDQHHYLRSSRIVGRQLKYLAIHDGHPIACLGWGDSAWAQSARDTWIGWTATQRTRNRHRIINNCRFLILPWVKIPNLASWLIARCSAAAVKDWQDQYSIRPALLETFVDSERFLGTCYKAANWSDIGVTSGYAKVGNSHHNSQSPKLVFVYPVTPRFRDILRGRKTNDVALSR